MMVMSQDGGDNCDYGDSSGHVSGDDDGDGNRHDECNGDDDGDGDGNGVCCLHASNIP